MKVCKKKHTYRWGSEKSVRGAEHPCVANINIQSGDTIYNTFKCDINKLQYGTHTDICMEPQIFYLSVNVLKSFCFSLGKTLSLS